MTPPDLAIEIDIAHGLWTERLPDLEALCCRVLGCAATSTTPRLPELAAAWDGGVFEVSILFTDDEAMRQLNARWRGIDKPTDVLSFPNSSPTPPGSLRFLGDIALALGVAERDASDMQKSIEFQTAHLLCHGFLHLIGHDHEETSEAELMEGMERSILGSLGWPDPYEVLTHEQAVTDGE